MKLTDKERRRFVMWLTLQKGYHETEAAQWEKAKTTSLVVEVHRIRAIACFFVRRMLEADDA
jgi:hypothetical protein